MWISRAEYDRLLAAVDAAEQRAERAEKALASERDENRYAERWMSNMLLRRAGTYPVPDKAPPLQGPPAPIEIEQVEGSSEVPGMDQGELDALIATGAGYGHTSDEVIAQLLKERSGE